jgi:hypothetical protein
MHAYAFLWRILPWSRYRIAYSRINAGVVRDKHADWPVEHAFGGDDNAVDRRKK